MKKNKRLEDNWEKMKRDHHVRPIEKMFIDSLLTGVSMSQALSDRKSRRRAETQKHVRRENRTEDAQRRDRKFLAIIDTSSKEEMFIDNESADAPWLETETCDHIGTYIRLLASSKERVEFTWNGKASRN